MTHDHRQRPCDRTAAHRGRPRRAAPAARRSAWTRSGSPAASGRDRQARQRAPRPSRTSSTGWSARAGSRNFDARRRRDAAATAARGRSSPTPRSTSCSRRWPGRSAAPATPALEARFRRAGARGWPPRRSRTATSTPTSAGPASGRGTVDLEWGHELYCVGHLIQAAVARARTRPDADDGLLGGRPPRRRPRLRRLRPDGIASVCGHPEIEPALVELGRVTGERALPRPGRAVRRAARHRDAARTSSSGRAYYQDDVPVREATVLRGHAVRANYLAAGAVDVAVETGDAELLDAVDRAVGDTRSRGAPTSPAARARTTRTRRSATTSRCRRTAPTPRPARASAR